VADAAPAARDRGLLHNRAFLSIWAAQILSQVAANAVTSALIILVAELTHSNTSSSLLILLAVLPAVLFGIAGGVIVDRSDKRLVLVITNVLRAVSIVPILVFGTSLTVAYLVNFMVATVTIFFVPAESATIPAIVRKRDLLVANSLFTFTFNGAFLVGFIILAPIVVSLYGYELLWVVIVLMFAIAAALCSSLPPAQPPERHLDVHVAGEVAGLAVAQTRAGLSEAFGYLRSTPLVTWSMVYIALTYTLVAIAGALAPGFVREVLKVGERNVVILVGPAGIGVVAGLGFLNVIGARWRRPNAIGTGLVVAFAALITLAAARPFAALFTSVGSPGLGAAFPVFAAIVSITAFFFGISYAFVTVPAMTLLQEELRDNIRGRVFGVLNMLVSVFSLLPLVIVGPFADAWGVAPVFVAAAIVVGGVWIMSRNARERGIRPSTLVTE
jgi:MFS family permease